MAQPVSPADGVPVAENAESIFSQISAVHPGPGQYDRMDQYRDFRAVFLSNEQGRRVLHEILLRGQYFAPSLPRKGLPIDTNQVIALEGGRRLAMEILETISKEPAQERPTTQTRRAPKT